MQALKIHYLCPQDIQTLQYVNVVMTFRWQLPIPHACRPPYLGQPQGLRPSTDLRRKKARKYQAKSIKSAAGLHGHGMWHAHALAVTCHNPPWQAVVLMDAELPRVWP
jgi:hypothetical protein